LIYKGFFICLVRISFTVLINSLLCVPFVV